MTNEVKNIPKLRFPEFNEEWEDNNLKDITTLLKDGTHGTHKDVENGPWLLSAKNIKNNTINISDEDRKISITDYNKIYKNYTLEREDILLSIVGTIGRVSMVKNPVNIAFQRSVAIIRFSKPLESKFFLYLFGTKEFKKKLYRNQVISAQPGIYLGDLAKFNIIYPLIIEEQQKIGNFFSKLDQQIELEEQKLAKLEEQKKGYMQKIFSKELRFKDENGNNYPEWEEKKLKELIDVRDGTHESPKPSKEGYLLVTSKNLKNSKLDLSESYFISKEDYESINQRSKVEIGDILFGMIGTIGNPILLEECDFAIKNVALLKTNDLLEKYYILNFLKSSNISKQFYRMNAGGTQKFIALSTIRDLNIDMPSSEEAIKIGNFFNKVDNLIENQLNKVELLKQRKQSFLQKMFV